MAASLLGLGLFLHGGSAPAQQADQPSIPSSWFRPVPPAPAQPPTAKPVVTVPVVPTLGASAPARPAAKPPATPTPLLIPRSGPATPSTMPDPEPPRPALVTPAVGAAATQFTTQKQPTDVTTRPPDETNLEYQIQLTPPGPQRLFRLESEAALHERMRQEARERPAPERIEFPVEPIISRESYEGRFWPGFQECVEPSYLCHKRLYFEEPNAERYGWDFGIFQPILSTAYFYWDVAWWPYKIATRPCDRFECSAGKCLPGDPVPYKLYPPEISVTGFLAEAGTIATLIAVFP
jgi:hypothetical protein